MNCPHLHRQYDGEYTYQGKLMGRSWRCQTCGTSGMDRADTLTFEQRTDFILSEELLRRFRESGLV